MGLSREPAARDTATCLATGKAIFTKSGAKSAAKRGQRSSGRNIKAYDCRACGGWHIGTLRGIAEGIAR